MQPAFDKLKTNEIVFYNDIYNYFDEWIIVLVNEETHEITGFKMKRKTENHIETIDW